MSPNILNTLDLSGAPEAVEKLRSVGQLTILPADRCRVLSHLRQMEAYLANASVRIDAEFLDAAPNLRVIGSPSTGSDHMDVDEIRARGIELFDIATEYSLINSFSATSELAFGLILAVNRKLKPAFVDADQGIWARERYTGFQLLGKTLGIVGLGRLGKISARIGQGFGMRVIASDPVPTATPGVEFVAFDDLIRLSDIITLHVHLTPQTEGLIGPRAFALMKPSAILINTSRGRVVDEASLLDALRHGDIAGAGLDVIDGEWMGEEMRSRHPLIQHARDNPNLVITPHIGGATTESIYNARVFMANKVADWLIANPR